MQNLLHYIDLVTFYLQNGEEPQIFDRKHVFMGIAESMLNLLEDESDTFEKMLEPQTI